MWWVLPLTWLGRRHFCQKRMGWKGGYFWFFWNWYVTWFGWGDIVGIYQWKKVGYNEKGISRSLLLGCINARGAGYYQTRNSAFELRTARWACMSAIALKEFNLAIIYISYLKRGTVPASWRQLGGCKNIFKILSWCVWEMNPFYANWVPPASLARFYHPWEERSLVEGLILVATTVQNDLAKFHQNINLVVNFIRCEIFGGKPTLSYSTYSLISRSISSFKQRYAILITRMK